MKKLIFLLALLLVLVPINSFAREVITMDNVIKAVDDLKYDETEILSEHDIEEMVSNNDFEGFEVEKDIEENEDGFIVETIKIKQDIEPINEKEMQRLFSSPTLGTRSIIHQWSEIRKSANDGSKTATFYITVDFDVFNYKNVDYVRVDKYRYSVFMHDSSFRAKEISGKVGQTGIGSIDSKGNAILGGSERFNFKKSYPVSRVSYGGYTNFKHYFNVNDSYGVQGVNGRAVLERVSTGGSLINIDLSVNW